MKAVHEDLVRHLAAAELQHGRPEQRVEGDDVLADEVDLLHRGVGHVGLEVQAAAVEQVLQRRQVTDRRVEPDVEVLARRVGDLNAEVGRVAADVPVVQARGPRRPRRRTTPCTLLATSLCSLPSCVQPRRNSTQRGSDSLKKKCSLLRSTGRGAGQRRIRVLQVGGRIHRAADLAVVAVLVLRTALRAFALDVAVGQEHGLHRVEELLDGARGDQPVGAQRAVDVLAPAHGSPVPSVECQLSKPMWKPSR